MPVSLTYEAEGEDSEDAAMDLNVRAEAYPNPTPNPNPVYFFRRVPATLSFVRPPKEAKEARQPIPPDILTTRHFLGRLVAPKTPQALPIAPHTLPRQRHIHFSSRETAFTHLCSMEMTSIRKHHATASPKAAAPIVITPTSVSIRLRSVNIRANIGKAVMDKLSPVKSRNEEKGTSSVFFR